MNFKRDPKFDKEFKKLGKKYRNLANDMELFKRVHQRLYGADANQDFARNFFASQNAAILNVSDDGCLKIIKARLDSSDLNSKDLRVIYCCDAKNGLIILTEIYAKNQKGKEDVKRWRDYLNQ